MMMTLRGGWRYLCELRVLISAAARMADFSFHFAALDVSTAIITGCKTPALRRQLSQSTRYL